MDEISTSFCFICLLHLANERGLKLKTGNEDASIDETMDDVDRKIGNIWDLKVLAILFGSRLIWLSHKVIRCIETQMRRLLHSRYPRQGLWLSMSISYLSSWHLRHLVRIYAVLQARFFLLVLCGH